MRFSIVIPNLNSPTIHHTIDALLRQYDANRPFEIIVAGLDEPELVTPSAIVRFICTDNPVSPGMGRNIGTRHASGELVCFLDADCVPCADWLHRIDQHFQDPSINVLAGGVECSDTSFWMRCEYISSFHEFMVTSPEGTREQLPTMNLVIRRSVFDQVGEFDESLPGGEDADLTLRLRQFGYPLYFDPKASVDHLPNRRTPRTVMRRTWWYAYHSMKMHPRWKDYLRTPLTLRYRYLLLSTSPLLALGVTAKIYWRNRSIWRWWYMAPFVFGLKMVWCLAAAERLRTRPL